MAFSIIVLMSTAFEHASYTITMAEYRCYSFKDPIDFEGLSKLFNVSVEVVSYYVHFTLFDNNHVNSTMYM